MYNYNNKRTFLENNKTLSTNIAVNGLYDTKLCEFNTVYCHTDHLPQCWSEVLFFIYLNVCYYC